MNQSTLQQIKSLLHRFGFFFPHSNIHCKQVLYFKNILLNIRYNEIP